MTGRRLRIALLVAAALASGVAAYALMRPGPPDALARAIVETCSKDSYPPRCYDTELPKLMDDGLSMEEAFAVAREIQETTGSYYYCHVLGHNLSAKETAKDPSAWTEVIERCPTGMCSNGCLHGAAQERFRSDAVSSGEVEAAMPEIARLCAGDMTAGDRTSCTHALGHLFMYLTGADAASATALCDRVADESLARTCYEGAYMQIFQPLEPEDVALVRSIDAATPEAAAAYCDGFSGDRRAACFRESWPVYGDAIETAEGVRAFCALVPGERAERDCYGALSYILAAKLLYDEERIADLCAGLPEERRGLCFGSAASRYLATDARLIPDALALCEAAEARGSGDGCYAGLARSAPFTFGAGSPDAAALCAALPPERRDLCRVE